MAGVEVDRGMMSGREVTVAEPNVRIHHIDPKDGKKCAVCGIEWPCPSFLLTLAGGNEP